MKPLEWFRLPRAVLTVLPACWSCARSRSDGALGR
jgi:hypothetical protein